MAINDHLKKNIKNLESDLKNNWDYKKFKKNKSGWSKKIRRDIEFIIFIFGSWVAKFFPIEKLQSFGKFIGRIIFILNTKEKGIIMMQLKKIFPNLNIQERKIWTLKCFNNFGQLFMEFLGMEKIEDNWDKIIEVKNEEIFFEAINKKKGVLLMAMHIGNWELISIFAKKLKILMYATTTNFPEEIK